MGKSLSLGAVLIVLLGAGVCQAQTLLYDHDGAPLFSVTYPEGWIVDLELDQEAREAGTYTGGELEIRVIEAWPSDQRRLWLGLWVAPDVGNFDEGLAYAASLQQDLFTDLENSEPRTTTLGGMEARVVEGTARREGEDVELLMALFEPRSGTIAVALYAGRPEARELHREDLEAIIDSLAPAGG